jgi:exodeoxyribonuclease VII small subunit
MKGKRGEKKLENYEATVNQVESLISEIESGDLPLEQVFDKFAIAVEQLRSCEAFLNQGKARINLLIETLEDEVQF